MDPAIARYLPEFAPAPVPAKGAAPATAFGDPWAGLARAPRVPVPLPVAEAPDAIRVEPARADRPPAERPLGGLLDGPPADWQDGLLPRAPKPASAPPPVAPSPLLLAPVASPAIAIPDGAEPAIPASPFVKPAAPKRETPEERAALLAAAEERGRQQGLAEAREEAEIARLRAAEAAEARLAEARRHWSEAEAEALADGFSAALRALDAALSDRIARLLVPVLTDALRRQAVAELSGALARLLSEPQAANVRVSGPEDLLAALAARLGPLAAAVTFTASETAEVQVSADQTVIETQLGAWTRLLAAAVAET
ncbi:hypothetical protein ACQVP2_17580 [Methylobacterium aquaticum]|uniref:hypothetical protein n=1 Tax=Methylobacterium aquaticum TaxID=270351 RepID=UPI003D166C5F